MDFFNWVKAIQELILSHECYDLQAVHVGDGFLDVNFIPRVVSVHGSRKPIPVDGFFVQVEELEDEMVPVPYHEHIALETARFTGFQNRLMNHLRQQEYMDKLASVVANVQSEKIPTTLDEMEDWGQTC